MKAHRQPLWFGLAALGLTLALFWPEHTLLEGYDWTRMHLLYKEHYREALLAGRLPRWNPFSALGRPFLGDMETATLYPPNLLYLGGVAPGLVLSIWFHLVVVLWGTFRCAERLGCGPGAAWFAALGFALGAPLLGHLQSGQIQLFATIAWLPLAIHQGCALQDGRDARAAVRFSGCLAMMFLAGHPPQFWVGAWGTVAFLIARQPTLRGLGRVAGSSLLAAGLVGIQALPFLELVAQGNRPVHDPAFATAYGQGASWWSLLRSKPPGPYYYNWEFNLYMGLPLALVAIAALIWWRRLALRALLVTAILFAILAAGAATPVLPWLAEHVPGWGAGRFPSRYAVVTAFCIALLAGLGLERCVAWLRSHGPFAARWAAFAAILLILANTTESFRALVERSAMYAGPGVVLRETEIEARLHQTGLLSPGRPPPRLIAHFGLVRENSGLARGYSTFTSYSSPMLARVWDYLHTMVGAPPASLEPIKLPVALYESGAAAFRGINAVACWDLVRQELVLEPHPDPRVYICTSVQPVRDWAEAHHLIKAGHPFHHVALVESAFAGNIALPETVPASSSPGIASITSFRPEEITLRYTSATPGLLVLAEAWFPGWRATIDGQPTAVLPANGWMRGVFAPAGSHEVSLSFRPIRLWQGGLISLLAVGVAAVLWFRGSRPPRSFPPA